MSEFIFNKVLASKKFVFYRLHFKYINGRYEKKINFTFNEYYFDFISK